MTHLLTCAAFRSPCQDFCDAFCDGKVYALRGANHGWLFVGSRRLARRVRPLGEDQDPTSQGAGGENPRFPSCGEKELWRERRETMSCLSSLGRGHRTTTTQQSAPPETEPSRAPAKMTPETTRLAPPGPSCFTCHHRRIHKLISFYWAPHRYPGNMKSHPTLFLLFCF